MLLYSSLQGTLFAHQNAHSFSIYSFGNFEMMWIEFLWEGRFVYVEEDDESDEVDSSSLEG